VPPKRCPECGRFLSNELVASLADTSLPCPRCEAPLEADKLVGGTGASRRPSRRQAGPATPSAPAAAPTAAAAPAAVAADDHSVTEDTGQLVRTAADSAGDAASVRPPDLDPSEVQDPGDDVLTGWDVGVTAEEIGSWRADRRPFPVDTVAVAAGAVLGSVLGVAVTERRRVLGAALGGLGGIAAVGAARRLWELPG
jgi:hypothetical protein